MENKSNSDGLGIIKVIVFLLSVSFFISTIKNCEGRSIYESVVLTAKEYYLEADSIWNK